MSRIVSKITACLLVLALLFGCSGPAPEGGGSLLDNISGNISRPLSRGTASKNNFHRLLDKGVMRQNNLEVTTVEETEYEEYTVISGLRDKALEQAINDRIYEVFVQMRDISFVPPYRGMAVKQKQNDFGSMEKYIYSYVACNANNLLSVLMYATYYNDDFYFSYSVPLNYDLSTGREVKLSDLFDTRTDYISRINDKVYDAIESGAYDADDEDTFLYGDDLFLTSPFGGVSAEQKFYISENNEIVLIFDYDTPEFAVSYSDRHLYLEDIDGMYTASKYDRQVFTDTSVHYMLLSGSVSMLDEVYDFGPLLRDDAKEYYADWTISTYSSLPQEINDFQYSLAQDSDKALIDVQRFAEQTGELSESLGAPCGFSLSADVYCRATRGYLNVEQHTFAQQYTVDFDDDFFLSFSRKKLYCFREDGVTEVSVDDIFRRGVDYQALLREAILENRRDRFPEYDERITAYLCDIYLSRINGINVGTNQLSLSFDVEDESNISDDAIDYMLSNISESGNVDSCYGISSVIEEVPYEYMDCTKLTIFD